LVSTSKGLNIEKFFGVFVGRREEKWKLRLQRLALNKEMANQAQQ